MCRLEIIIGCMFSGKSTELIRRMKRLRVLRKNMLIINSSKDTRQKSDVINTHDNVSLECVKTDNLDDIFKLDTYVKSHIIAIDEAQFFKNLRKFVEQCIVDRKYIIVAGLDGDFKQNIFGEIIDLIPLADDVTKLHALCKECNDGTLASFSKRLVSDDNQELVGASDMYTSVCRKHLGKN